MNLKYPWQLYHWHFGPSSKCILKCPRCPRTEYKDQLQLNQDISLDLFRRILTPDLLKHEVVRITMGGDLGDPIYNSEYLDIVEYIKTNNPNIHLTTITNGSYKKPEWWEKFAKLSNDKDTINFGIDGYDNRSNNIYRVDSNWDSIMTGMRIMATQSQVFVNWAVIIFQFNQEQLRHIEQMARDIGCDGLQVTKSTKFGSKYEVYGGSLDKLEPSKENVSSSYRYERMTIPLSTRQLDSNEYFTLNRFKFAEIKKQHNQVVTPLCCIGTQGIFVNADGILFPCSWKSLPYARLNSKGVHSTAYDDFLIAHRDELNLNNHSLETVLNNPIWSQLFDNLDSELSWDDCKSKCNSQLVDEKYAVKWETN
jgi:MoaA/NifB/PqqE/SkfB family radical SAM enzyme